VLHECCSSHIKWFLQLKGLQDNLQLPCTLKHLELYKMCVLDPSDLVEFNPLDFLCSRFLAKDTECKGVENPASHKLYSLYNIL